MLKNSKYILVLLIIVYCKTCYSSSSASYLISKIAFSNHDFSQVLNEYNNLKSEKFDEDYLEELIAAVISEKLILAQNISNIILQKDLNNKEAKLFIMANAFKNSSYEKLNLLRLDDKNNKNDLFEFLFFNGDQLKNNKEISKAFLEIVKSSYLNKNSDYLQNYNFLLFYVSLSIMINENNYEAIYIKGQLLQIIENYLFAETTYLKIPKKSNFFLDSQRSIALNYFKEENFDTTKNKILKIIQNNKQDYELRKILADFYRIEKKYTNSINIYSSLAEENREDSWYIFYLRGICYERSGDWERAELDFLKSLELKPDSPNVLNYLAYGWIERGERIEQSFKMLTDAYNANPNSYYILDSLAWAYFKKKEYYKAAELMEKVIDMVPGEAISLDHLGDIYFAMNRKREAIYFWNQAKDLSEIDDEILDKIDEKLRFYNVR